MKARNIGELKSKMKQSKPKDAKWWRSNILTGAVTCAIMTTVFWGVGLFN